MKGIRVQRHISLNTIIIYFALFCVSSYALLERVTVSIAAFSPMKIRLLYLGFICIFTQIKTLSRCILKKKYFYTLSAVLLFCMALVFSMLANSSSEQGMPLYDTVRLLLYLVELFALMVILAETGRGQATLKFLFVYTLLIVFVNDVLMFSRFITFGTKRYENYLIGTKFSVSYMHMNLLALWLMLYANRHKGTRRGKWFVLLATVYIVMVTLRTNCMTGLLGCILLGVVFEWLQTKHRKQLMRLTTPGMFSLAMGVSVVCIWILEAIVNIPIVSYFVEEILKRDISITGRTGIYQMIFTKMQGHWLQGYGYGNDYESAMELFGYANVQNGLMQWVFQIGIPATVCLFLLFFQVFRQLKRSEGNRRLRVMPLVILVYTYIVLATIETTISMSFILWIALVFMLVTEKKDTSLEMQWQRAG